MLTPKGTTATPSPSEFPPTTTAKEEANPVEAYLQGLVSVCGVVVEEIREEPKKAAAPAMTQNTDRQSFFATMPDDYIEDVLCTPSNGEEVNARQFVPPANVQETPKTS